MVLVIDALGCLDSKGLDSFFQLQFHGLGVQPDAVTQGDVHNGESGFAREPAAILCRQHPVVARAGAGVL